MFGDVWSLETSGASTAGGWAPATRPRASWSGVPGPAAGEAAGVESSYTVRALEVGQRAQATGSRALVFRAVTQLRVRSATLTLKAPRRLGF